MRHKGVTAECSVDKLTECAWLLGLDDLVRAMDLAPYSQYGAPKLRVLGVALGWWAEPVDDELARMANGQPCTPGCQDGCGK